ncbi:MAG: outer membrane beta-barrel protein [Salinivirgaceae bacterium]|jgi:hypothetical protein
MKKTRALLKSLLIVSVLAFTISTATAQFEQKFTLHGSFGFAMPTGAKEFISGADTYPYLFSNFSSGISVSGGVQYNINRRFSIAANIGFLDHWGWEYGSQSFDNVQFWNLQIGIAPKFYLLASKKVNPYLFTEVNLNYTSIYVMGLTAKKGYPGIGFYPGAGIDFMVSDNFGIYVQGGYSFISVGSDPYSFGESENYKALKIEVGIKISFLKSKTI